MKFIDVYSQILNYRTLGNPVIMEAGSQMPNTQDIVIFCNVSRWQTNFNGVNPAPGKAYDSDTGINVPMEDAFMDCLSGTPGGTTQAITFRSDHSSTIITSIQLCPAYLNSVTRGISTWVSAPLLSQILTDFSSCLTWFL